MNVTRQRLPDRERGGTYRVGEGEALHGRDHVLYELLSDWVVDFVMFHYQMQNVQQLGDGVSLLNDNLLRPMYEHALQQPNGQQ